MSSDDDGNVIDFGRRTGLTGFTLSPVQPADPQGPVIPPLPAAAPTNGTAGGSRRSPLDALAALPSSTLTAPPVVVTPSASGGLPDTFRGPGSGGGGVGPRMGALSLAACLAVAVAALRGSCIFFEDLRQRHLMRQADTAPLRAARLKHQLAMAEYGYGTKEAAAKYGLDVQKAGDKHAAAMQGIGGKAAEQRAKQRSKVPSGQDFGRKSLSGRGGALGGGGAGKGAGAGGKGLFGGGSGGGGKSGLGAGAKKGPGKVPAGLGGSKNAGKGAGADLKKLNGKGSGLPGLAKKDGGPSALHKKAPLNGKASAGTATPAMERARRRQDRRDKGQDARLKRRATADAARHKEQAKDNKAARDHEFAAKRARQNAKDKIRNARMEAREGRKEQVRQGKFDTVQQRRAQKAAARQHKKDAARDRKTQNKAAGGDRTTLWDALKKDTADGARDRWAKRDGVPPLWKNDKKRHKKTGKTGADDGAKPSTGPGKDKPKHSAPGPGRGERWRRARDRARNARDQRTNGGSTGGPQTPPAGGTAAPGGPHPRQGRKSPFENAATGATEWTVERDDQPASPSNDTPAGALSSGVDALPPAPEPHTARPGTSRPKEPIAMPPAIVPSQDPRLVKARNQAARAGAVVRQARHMDAQHDTEITLDDALDEYGHFKDDAFKTHQQCDKLSSRARRLATALEDFSEELAVSHNIIGILFTGAMANLSESMELVASMADEMEVSSLAAAEMSETADNELNDAYRPISQATADAGLTTPSAPVHNQT